MDSDKQGAPIELGDNDLAAWLTASTERIRPHLGTLLLIAVVLVGALAAMTLIRSQRIAGEVAAWDDCLTAFAGDDQAGLETVVNEFPGSTAAGWAQLMLADRALADGNQLMAIADTGRGRSRLEDAERLYSAVNAGQPRELAAERAILGLARSRESLGDLEGARRGYRTLVDEYPASPFRGQAEDRIAALSRPTTEGWYKWFASRPAPAADPAGGVGSAVTEPVSDEPARSPAEPARGEPAGSDAPPG